MEQVEIHEAGLVLRPWQAADIPQLYRAGQDPDVHRWTAVPSPYTEDRAREFATEFTPRVWSAGTGAPVGVFDAETGELLGSNGLIFLDLEHGVAEVGYWTAPWGRGRRVAENGTRAIARWAFGKLGVHRLVWRAEVGNHASRLVAERVGMTFEGVQRGGERGHDGSPLDMWVAALLPGELREADAPLTPALRRAARRTATFMAAQPSLTTQAAGVPVTLRPVADRDIDAIVASCDDPESLRWTTIPDPYRTKDAEYFAYQHAPALWRRGDGAVYAICGPDGGYAGSIELRIGTADPTSGDVGFLVAPWARGRGYASAALRALCAWGFGAFSLDRIEWRAYVGNHGSRRVAERAGFTVEGVARQALVHRGVRRDCWVGAVLASDYAADPAVP